MDNSLRSVVLLIRIPLFPPDRLPSPVSYGSLGDAVEGCVGWPTENFGRNIYFGCGPSVHIWCI